MINLVPNIIAHWKMNDNAQTPWVANRGNTPAELVTNGTCDTDSDWTKNGDFQYDADEQDYYVHDSGPAADSLVQDKGVFVNGTAYRMSFLVTEYDSAFSGACLPSIGGTTGNGITAAERSIQDITCGANTDITLATALPTTRTFAVDQISAYKIADYPLTGYIRPIETSVYLSQEGKIGECIEFNGSSQYIKVPYEASLYVHPSMTVAFWAYSDVTNYGGVSIICIGMWEFDKLMWYIGVLPLSDKWCVGVAGATKATSQVVQNSWNHIAFVVNNTNKTWNFYYNGSWVEQLTTTYSYADLGSMLGIGGRASITPNYFWDGKLDDVRMYNKELSAAEIAWIYNSGNGTESQSTIPIIHHLKQAGGL